MRRIRKPNTLLRFTACTWMELVCGNPHFASSAPPADSQPKSPHAFVFTDTSNTAGLFPDVAGIRGHAAGWGDVDGDGWVDLYVGTFAENGSKGNLLFHNDKGKFGRATADVPAFNGRTNSALFADLDNDGDLDLYVASMPKPEKQLRGCGLFRNDGKGKFTDISPDNGACPKAFGGRSGAVLDFDGDGLLDLLVGEDPLSGYNGSPTKSSRLFRNLGNLQFADVSREAGIPENVPGLGVAAADVNNDGWPDLFIASHNGGNVLLINDRHGKFHEPGGARRTFAWPNAGPNDNMIAGVCFGDVNRDGLLDIVIGQHFKTPWVKPVSIRLYLNRGIDADGNPKFEDVTEAAGIKPLPMKAPHVELQDFDNDGWPDIQTSIVKLADGKPYPVIYRNLGPVDEKVGRGMPRFSEDAMSANDFPTAEDRATTGTGAFFEKLNGEKKITYTAGAPSADYDNDGRLDLFLPNWFAESRSMLLHNNTPGGHWLDIQVRPAAGNGVNSTGIGARIIVYPAGLLDKKSEMIACREIATGFGYVSGQPAIAHFGLGEVKAVDVRVILPHGGKQWVRKNVPADQRITMNSEDMSEKQ